MENFQTFPIVEIFGKSYTKGGGQTINDEDTNSKSGI